mmetsp:Transcript_47519/g.99402  ORF Transcript_47519/g.99402 Transcript_47519/m.99402 type:complete len:337 (-) Transcript_47519:221-1231(-)
MILNFLILIFSVAIWRCDGVADSEAHSYHSQSSLREYGRLFPKSLNLTPLTSNQCAKKESADQIKENFRSSFVPMKPRSGDFYNKLTFSVCRSSVLHLRGGLFENIGSLCSCFSVCDSEAAVHDENDHVAKKRRVGKMAQSVEIKANSQKVYKVVSDIEHYRDWSGDGLRSIKILENGRGYAVAEYVCGTFGITFHFSMYWGLSSPGKVTFRTVAPAGMIHMLKGEYTLTEKGPNLTGVHFVVIADLRGPIPQFLKVAIAKILVHIALNDMKKYVESPQCDINLARYDSGLNLAQRLTRLYTDVPSLVLRHNFARLALECLRAAAGGLLARQMMAK